MHHPLHPYHTTSHTHRASLHACESHRTESVTRTHRTWVYSVSYAMSHGRQLLSSTPQARPVYGGWLCLAPEGTNFENAGHRSRKWQRRFFVLFEHGGLQFALDSSPSTLPQGTLNLAQCTEVAGAEERTGRKHSLRIAAPDRELFIGGESREDISAWHARLVALARGSRTNHVKKRRAEVQLEQDVIVTHAVQVDMSIPVDPAHRSPNAERMDPPRCSVTRCPAGTVLVVHDTKTPPSR
ncbi:myosin phosphatase Rho-interacting protein-like [Lampetra planeri]